MFNTGHEETKLEKHALQAENLQTRFEELEKKFARLFEEYQITEEDLQNFMQNRHNFSKETWEKVLEIRDSLDVKLKLELENIANPAKTRSSYDNLRIGKDWLFVR